LGNALIGGGVGVKMNDGMMIKMRIERTLRQEHGRPKRSPVAIDPTAVVADADDADNVDGPSPYKVDDAEAVVIRHNPSALLSLAALQWGSEVRVNLKHKIGDNGQPRSDENRKEAAKIECLILFGQKYLLESLPAGDEVQPAVWKTMSRKGVRSCFAARIPGPESIFRPAKNGVCATLAVGSPSKEPAKQQSRRRRRG
jgi:hypothetical protein